MYLSVEHIVRALEELRTVHPFYGITFIACKKAGLRPGNLNADFSMDAVTRRHMEEHHRPIPGSQHFFQPFYKSAGKWLAPKYPSSGLQAINTQSFATAFEHEPNTNVWKWADDYIDHLEFKLPRRRLIPAFALCVWLYRRHEFAGDYSPSALIRRFFSDYGIHRDERRRLFDIDIPSYASAPLVQRVVSWEDLSLSRPPDVAPASGGRLAYLSVMGAGPVSRIEVEPAERLTLIAGDNGLGKTFLLDCAWWALTGAWASMPAAPREDGDRRVSIEFTVRGTHGDQQRPQRVRYSWKSLDWDDHPGSDTLAGLVVYA